MPDVQEQRIRPLWPKWSSNISLYALFDVFRLSMDDCVTLCFIPHRSLQHKTKNRSPVGHLVAIWFHKWVLGKVNEAHWHGKEKNMCVEFEVHEKDVYKLYLS